MSQREKLQSEIEQLEGRDLELAQKGFDLAKLIASDMVINEYRNVGHIGDVIYSMPTAFYTTPFRKGTHND